MHNVFISYHHDNDQWYKEELLRMNDQYGIFNDGSVDIGEISDDLSDEAIRTKIRDEYLRETSVTILLAGTDTWGRKHIDWELFSSMFDGPVNKKSGILVINLPSVNCTYHTAPHGENEKTIIHPECSEWMSIDSRSEYQKRYPHLSDRIIDNLLKKEAKISIISWDKISNNPEKLKFLISLAHDDRTNCEYDLSRSMRRKNADEI